jgi:hypothetical protein
LVSENSLSSMLNGCYLTMWWNRWERMVIKGKSNMLRSLPIGTMHQMGEDWSSWPVVNTITKCWNTSSMIRCLGIKHVMILQPLILTGKV